MFNISSILAAIIASFTTTLKGIATESIPVITNTITTYAGDAAHRLGDLAQSYAKGLDKDGITKEFLTDRLKDEGSILKSELMSLETLGESIAQAVVNTAIELLQGAITAVQLPPAEA
jgi:hypothetical protein